MRNAIFLMAILIATFVIPATDAMAGDDVYRWVDENGDVHYSDKSPEQIKAEIVEIQTAPDPANQPVANSAAVTSPQQPSAAQQQREERALKRKESASKQQALEASCKQRREYVSQLEPSTRVMVRAEDGEVYRLDDNERLKALDEAKSYISANCDN